MARGLGKGLDALLSGSYEAEQDEQLKQVSISECRANPYQPRKTFNPESIDELKQSIIEHGIIQPLVVRKSIKGYEIVAGERRFRAAKEAGLKEVPVIVREMSDESMMEVALLENLQREDLTPIEEAYAYKNLLNELGLKQDDLSQRLGKSRSHIANMMRLLALPEIVINEINTGELSMGHGRALLGLNEKDHIELLANKVIREQLSVRQVEKLVSQLNEHEPRTKEKGPEKDIYIAEQESVLREKLGTSVKIQRGKRKGKIEIEFYNEDDLERIIEFLDK